MIDKQDFLALLDAKSQSLYRVARSILRSDQDCQDALQACALKAWTSYHRLRDEALFPAWITRILINECRNIQRKGRKYHLTAEVEGPAFTPAPDPDLQAALDDLPEKWRLPLILHYVEGYSIQEIAALLHLTQGAVKGRLFQARKALRLELEPEKEVVKA